MSAPRKHIVEKYYFEKASAIPGYDIYYRTGLIEITDPAYRIGSKKAGVGSTSEQIEKAYKCSKPIVDLKDPNVKGYIDGGIWVDF